MLSQSGVQLNAYSHSNSLKPGSLSAPKEAVDIRLTEGVLDDTHPRKAADVVAQPLRHALFRVRGTAHPLP